LADGVRIDAAVRKPHAHQPGVRVERGVGSDGTGRAGEATYHVAAEVPLGDAVGRSAHKLSPHDQALFEGGDGGAGLLGHYGLAILRVGYPVVGRTYGQAVVDPEGVFSAGGVGEEDLVRRLHLVQLVEDVGCPGPREAHTVAGDERGDEEAGAPRSPAYPWRPSRM
jgi:hypothetical protein